MQGVEEVAVQQLLREKSRQEEYLARRDWWKKVRTVQIGKVKVYRQIDVPSASDGRYITDYFNTRSNNGEEAPYPRLDWMDIGRGFCISMNTESRDIYDAYLKTYDFAMPQPWVEENFWKKGFCTPLCVWCYDGPEHKLFGAPVFMKSILKRMGDDAWALWRA